MQPEFNGAEQVNPAHRHYPGEGFLQHPPSMLPPPSHPHYTYPPYTSTYYPYPYQSRPYQTTHYSFEQYPPWRENVSYTQPNSHMGSSQRPTSNFSKGRPANRREIKEKKIPDVIVIESNEQPRYPSPISRNSKAKEKKEIRKDPVVIEIEDDSPVVQLVQVKKDLQKPRPNISQSEKIHIKNKNPEQNNEREEQAEKEKVKEKYKPICKEKNGKDIAKGKKIIPNNDKGKEKKNFVKGKGDGKIKNKQLRSLLNNQPKYYPRPDRKKKTEEKQKVVQTTKKNLEVQSQKFEQHPTPKPTKQKSSKISQKNPQITKYLQSHGQIRKGKEFQSKIPQINGDSPLEFHIWIEKKKKNVLFREVATFI